MILKRVSVSGSLLPESLLAIAVLGDDGEGPESPPPPVEPPPQNPYSETVAASGIIEAVNENVRNRPPGRRHGGGRYLLRSRRYGQQAKLRFFS